MSELNRLKRLVKSVHQIGFASAHTAPQIQSALRHRVAPAQAGQYSIELAAHCLLFRDNSVVQILQHLDHPLLGWIVSKALPQQVITVALGGCF